MIHTIDHFPIRLIYFNLKWCSLTMQSHGYLFAFPFSPIRCVFTKKTLWQISQQLRHRGESNSKVVSFLKVIALLKNLNKNYDRGRQTINRSCTKMTALYLIPILQSANKFWCVLKHSNKFLVISTPMAHLYTFPTARSSTFWWSEKNIW